MHPVMQRRERQIFALAENPLFLSAIWRLRGIDLNRGERSFGTNGIGISGKAGRRRVSIARQPRCAVAIGPITTAWLRFVAAAIFVPYRITAGTCGTIRGSGWAWWRDRLHRGHRSWFHTFDLHGFYQRMTGGIDGHHIQFERALDHHKSFEKSLLVGVLKNVLAVDLQSLIALQLRLEEP